MNTTTAMPIDEVLHGGPTAAESSRELTAEASRTIRNHYTMVAMRRGWLLTEPVRFVIDNLPTVYPRGAKGRAACYRDNRKGLALFGICGTGKTKALQFLKYAHEMMGVTVSFVEAIDMMNIYVGDGERAFWEEVRLYRGRDIILDDLGAERDGRSFGNASPVGDWIAKRYGTWQAGGPVTHLASNLTADDFIGRYGRRCYERIAEMCICRVFTGENLRGVE